MAGVKGKSGGPRPGAGRPPEAVTLRIGDTILATITSTQAPALWTVTGVSKAGIVFGSDNGDVIRLSVQKGQTT